MAGAGFKDFAAGDILTAADVDNYLMQQTVMVFDDSSARDTALTGVLAEGMFSYLKSDDTLYQYNGTAWEVAGSPEWLTNYPTNTPELAAESSGQVLMTTGSLATPVWQPMPTQNYIINGAFDIWQRGTSFTALGSISTADRWAIVSNGSGATRTITREAFTAAEAETVGKNGGQFYIKIDTSVAFSGQTFNSFNNKIEDVTTLAGQPITLTFWAKASTSVSGYAATQITQNFGSGGSSAVNTDFGSAIAYTTDWVKYRVSGTLPSISGKTIGAGNHIEVRLRLPLNSVASIQFANVQLEAGSIATPFKRHAPSLQGELAACQRYYYESNSASIIQRFVNMASSSANLFVPITLPVSMRANPTVTAKVDINDGSEIDATALIVNDNRLVLAQVNSVPSGQFTDLRKVTASAEL